MINSVRAWAKTYTDRGRYSPVGVVFHWVMAFLVLFQLGWGWYTSFLMPGGDKIVSYQVHSAAGLPILILAVGRFAWRIAIPGPENDADTQGWQSQTVYAIHYLLYLCFFGLPLSGWAMWSAEAAPGPLYLAGVIPWPQMPLEELSLEWRWAIMDVAEDVHHLLVWLLMFIVPLHVAAALKHHFWDRHDVLRGMLPEIPDAEQPRGDGRNKPQEPRLPAPSEAG